MAAACVGCGQPGPLHPLRAPAFQSGTTMDTSLGLGPAKIDRDRIIRNNQGFGPRPCQFMRTPLSAQNTRFGVQGIMRARDCHRAHGIHDRDVKSGGSTARLGVVADNLLTWRGRNLVHGSPRRLVPTLASRSKGLQNGTVITPWHSHRQGHRQYRRRRPRIGDLGKRGRSAATSRREAYYGMRAVFAAWL